MQCCCVNVFACYEDIKEQNLAKNLASFANQSLCSSLTMEQCSEFFREICFNTREYPQSHFELNKYFQ